MSLYVCFFIVIPQASSAESFPRVAVDFAVTSDDPFLRPSQTVDWRYHIAEEEIRLATRLCNDIHVPNETYF